MVDVIYIPALRCRLSTLCRTYGGSNTLIAI